MKKLLIILLFLPMYGLGQDQKNIIKIKPTSLLLGDFSLSLEREIINRHSITVGIPLYFKRDIAKMTLVKLLSPSLLPNASKSDIDDILDDAEGIGYFGGYGFVLKYKFYLNMNAEALTGFYISPEYYFRKFNINIDASISDLEDIYYNDNSPLNLPQNNYELKGDIRFNTISFNFGHQWIRDWFSIDTHIGLAHFSLNYDFEEQSGSYENDDDDLELIWLPRIGLNIGFAI